MKSNPMAVTVETPLSNKQISDLFELDSTDTEACAYAGMFYDAFSDSINDLSRKYGCGAWTMRLDWPALIKKCKETGGFKLKGPGIMVNFCGRWSRNEPDVVC